MSNRQERRHPTHPALPKQYLSNTRIPDRPQGKPCVNPKNSGYMRKHSKNV